MFQSPRRAKRLFFDVIPRAVDDYLTHLGKFPEQDAEKRFANPVWHLHGGQPPAEKVPVTFGMLLNLASACNAEDKTVLWGFISRYVPEATPESHAILDRLAGYAVAYYEGLVKPAKQYRAPSEAEREALEDLASTLGALAPDSDAEAIQYEIYEAGKRHGFENLRDWFKALYETLFGQSQGPRMGSFVALYGIKETVTLFEQALAGELAGSSNSAAS